MDAITIQYLAVGALFLVALVYLIRRTRRSLSGSKGCSKGCGCEFSEKTKTLKTE
ncbi:Virus attachment protein p12 family protein [Parapedobacter koreensis]|uniref:Virus attachment protein p12 family protein n=1 Tax=Parapedobacter koreensis TaxID=332977 RepID=A0A1H7G1W1_9SPHI|nr:Virus attachment protein p12 family protein [Parapedobacter koreensis]